MAVRLAYINCRSFPRAEGGIYDLLITRDIKILALQETWLAKQELHSLNVFDNYDSFGISKTDYEDGVTVGRNSGGVAFLWNRCLLKDFLIRPCDYGYNWLVGLDIIDKRTNAKFNFVNVYLPCNTQDNIDSFLECVGVLQQILEDCDTTRLMFCGDFNCDLSKHDRYCNILSSFISDTEIKCLDCEKLPSDTFTYVSDCWHTTSWIDHCLCTVDFASLIRNQFVDYGVTWSDHRPTIIDIECSMSPAISDENQMMEIVEHVNWHDKGVIHSYLNKTDELLDNINVDDLTQCRDTFCDNEYHYQRIEQLYNELVACLTSCAPSSRKRAFKTVPGWNDYVKNWHDASRESFLLWVDAGKPRQGPQYELMKRCKARFKYALKQSQYNEKSLRADALANKMLSKNYESFWKDVKYVNAAKLSLPSNIGDICGAKNIADMWKEHYSKLFNLCDCNMMADYNCTYTDGMIVTPKEVADCIKCLKCNKSAGPDGLVGEHFKFSSPKLHNILAVFISSMFVHGYMPDALIKSTLIPIVKNKCMSLSDIGNYRPIALSNVMTKIVERVMMIRMDVYLWTQPNQFGFQKDSGTDQCIYVFKELVNSYLRSGSTVYCCFLDASKAFDRVNHSRLMNILIERGVPLFIIRMLNFWYSKQSMSVRWGSVVSETFSIKNGVRQGSVLSPYLFNIYVNDLSVLLESVPCGLSYGNGKLNHIMYADDIVLMSPSAGALQSMLNICERFAADADLLFNNEKTFGMCITNQGPRYFPPDIYLNENRLKLVDRVKYLGHIITCSLNDDLDIDRQIRSLYCRSNMLVKKFNICTDYIKCFLFKAFCSNMYCCSLWLNRHMFKMRRLYVSYNNAIRRFLHLPSRCSASYMYVMADIPSPTCIIRKTCYSIYSRVRMSSKPLVKNIFLMSAICTGSFVSLWMRSFL